MARQPIKKIAPSRLDSQLQLLSSDLRVDNLVMVGPNGVLRLDAMVTDGYVNRTIEGASTLEITVFDRDKRVLNSGMLGAEVDVELDGLYFRLVKVRKSGQLITLTFESREVAILRTYNKKKTAAWGKTTRTRFAQSIIKEVKELKIPFVCPEMKGDRLQTPKTDPTADVDKQTDRDLGFGYAKNPGVGDRANENRDRWTVKGVPATQEQLRNIEIVLDTGVSMGARRKVLVSAIMTIIQESTARNLRGGDRDSLGLFQQRPSQGWGTPEQILDPVYASRSYYTRAIDSDASNPNQTYTELAQSVQRSAYPDAYASWRTESERLVTSYGMPGGDISSPAAVAAQNGILDWEPANSESTEFQFTRGHPKLIQGNKRGWTKENSWDCLVRLAEEVQWRCYEVSGTVYFISEKRLFQSAPRARISEESSGVNTIDFDYDAGKRNAKVTVNCRADRWVAPPGSTLELANSGPANGRWIVSDIRRNLFKSDATITLKKPRAKLPEPKQEDVTGLWDLPPAEDGGVRDQPSVVGTKPANPTGLIQLPVPNQTLPSSAPTHDTDGLPGYPAFDFMAAAGTPVFAPESGKIWRISGHHPNQGVLPGGIFGWSIYLEGISGTMYFLTHLDDPMAENSQVVVGQVIAKIGDWPGNAHLHFSIRQGSPLGWDDFKRLSAVSWG